MNVVDVFLAAVERWIHGFTVSLPFLIAGILVLVVAVLVGRAVRYWIRRLLRGYDPVLGRMIGQLADAAVIFLGILLAMSIAFPSINLADVLTSLGFTGLIVGFALRDLLENFAAGILLLWRRPFTIGDQIRSGAHEGTVEQINFRSTVLRTYDGVQTFIPNSQVFTAPLENLTSYVSRRDTILLRVSQATSVDRARDVALTELRSIEGVLKNPAPLVLFDEIGDYTINLAVLYWTTSSSRIFEREVRSVVNQRLFTAFFHAGIAFPYPVEVQPHVRSVLEQISNQQPNSG